MYITHKHEVFFQANNEVNVNINKWLHTFQISKTT